MNIVGFTDIEGMMRLAADDANYSIKPVTISEVLDLIQSQKSPITYCFYITGNQTVELFMKSSSALSLDTLRLHFSLENQSLSATQ